MPQQTSKERQLLRQLPYHLILYVTPLLFFSACCSGGFVCAHNMCCCCCYLLQRECIVSCLSYLSGCFAGDPLLALRDEILSTTAPSQSTSPSLSTKAGRLPTDKLQQMRKDIILTLLAAPTQHTSNNNNSNSNIN